MKNKNVPVDEPEEDIAPPPKKPCTVRRQTAQVTSTSPFQETDSLTPNPQNDLKEADHRATIETENESITKGILSLNFHIYDVYVKP